MLVTKTRIQHSYFWWGLAAGFFISFFIVSGIIYYYFFITGINVQIDKTQVNKAVKEQVAKAASISLTKVLESLHKEIPAKVGANIDQVKEGRFYLDDMEIKFSSQMMEEIRKNLYQKTIGYLDANLFDPEQYQPLMKDIVDEAYLLVDQVMEKEVYHKKIIWRPVNWFRVPITVSTKN